MVQFSGFPVSKCTQNPQILRDE